MTQNRREFLERLGAGATLAVVPLSPLSSFSSSNLSRTSRATSTSRDVVRALSAARTSSNATATAEEWDVTWANRVTGKYRAVFDVPEIDSGLGVWRASLWVQQYTDVLKASPSDCSAVVVLRHHGIALAMQQSFWDKYGVAASNTVIHPITEKPTDRNPVLLSSSRNEVPPDLDDVALDKYLARGGIALACNLALDDMVTLVSKKDGGTPEAARKTAIAGLIPGVVLQPSGVFAALHAQDVGCKYLRAS